MSYFGLFFSDRGRFWDRVPFDGQPEVDHHAEHRENDRRGAEGPGRHRPVHADHGPRTLHRIVIQPALNLT